MDAICRRPNEFMSAGFLTYGPGEASGNRVRHSPRAHPACHCPQSITMIWQPTGRTTAYLPSPPLINGGRGEVALSYSDQGIVTMRPLLPTLSIWQKCLSMTWLWYYDIDNLADPRRIANRKMRQIKGNQASYADDRTIHSDQWADVRAGISFCSVSHAPRQTVPPRAGDGNIATVSDAGFVLFAGHSHSLPLWKMAGRHG